jgi:hypothetical protein
VHYRLVADHAVLADYRWVTGVGVQHAAVLAAGNSLTLAFSLGLLRGVPRAFGGGPNGLTNSLPFGTWERTVERVTWSGIPSEMSPTYSA